MTLAFAPTVGSEADWLAYYKRVQSKADTRIRMALVQAGIDAEKAVLALEGKRGIGARVQTAQYNRVRLQLRKLIMALFTKQVGPIIKQGKLDAVGAAMDASTVDLRSFYQEVFPNPQIRRNFHAASRAQARRSIDTMMTRVLGDSYVPLSTSVYKSGRLASGWVDRVVNSGLARGASAKEIAAQVKSSINPQTPGGTSYAAFRLARTEINNAFHAQSIAQAQDSPFVSDMQWNLSGRHKADPKDKCEEYARIGTFSKSGVPLKPHPQCLCTVTPVLVSWGAFRENLLRGEYERLQDAA